MMWYSVLVVGAWSAGITRAVYHENNVCPTLQDYKTIFHNKKCRYNPDVGSNPRLIAKRYGYPFENHELVTDDGYILNLHRIPYSRDEKGSNGKRRQPILIVHGLAGSSAFWVLLGKRSLAFVLADNGYDVWLANLRGTYYSFKHINQTVKNSDYWNFGIHDIAVRDLPACIDFVTKRTGENGNLIYVGHSMGTTISYIYSSMMRKHAEDNLKAIISLAPVAYMGNVMGTFKWFAPSTPVLSRIFLSHGIYALGDQHTLQRSLLSVTCSKYPFIIPCQLLLIFSSGYVPEEFQPEILPVFISFYPSGVSIKTLQHFAQLIISKRFQMYDYGSTTNKIIYNNVVPPEYNVSQIPVPVHLYIGTEDIVGDLKDAEILASKLNQRTTRRFTFPFAHNDFFMAKHVDLFHKALLQDLRN